MTQSEIKAKEIQFALDKLQQGAALLRSAGYSETPILNMVDCAIEKLRLDIYICMTTKNKVVGLTQMQQSILIG